MRLNRFVAPPPADTGAVGGAGAGGRVGAGAGGVGRAGAYRGSTGGIEPSVGRLPAAVLAGLPAAGLAAALAGIAAAFGWHGVDTPAQVYRVDQYRAHGFQLWDFGWYSGHWAPGYSLTYPAVTAALGIATVTVLSAALAAFSFDRLVRGRLVRAPLERSRLGLRPAAGWAASLVCAAGTLVPAAIGQLSFLAGGALGLTALLLMSTVAPASPAPPSLPAPTAPAPTAGGAAHPGAARPGAASRYGRWSSGVSRVLSPPSNATQPESPDGAPPAGRLTGVSRVLSPPSNATRRPGRPPSANAVAALTPAAAALTPAAAVLTLAAAALALTASTTSPLAGAFVALAAVAWALPRWREPRVVVAGAVVTVAAIAPVLAGQVLFPGDGPMPYPVTDWAWEVVVAVAVGALAWRLAPAVVAGAALFVVTATVSVIWPSALGGNVGRIEDAVALPLAVGFAWERASRLPWRRSWPLLPVVAVPLALSQWGPAWGAMASAPALPSAQRAFFTPLDAELRQLGSRGPAGRVEVVPTEYHWEAAYVAPVMPLARGWERQLDEADNPVFYRHDALTPASYRAWLVANGVRFVALPSAPLDMAGNAEGTLVRSGQVPGLTRIWSDPDWVLYGVEGSPGVVAGPATLVATSGSTITLETSGAGTVAIRVHYSPQWRVQSGPARLTRDGDWLRLDATGPGTVKLAIGWG